MDHFGFLLPFRQKILSEVSKRKREAKEVKLWKESRKGTMTNLSYLHLSFFLCWIHFSRGEIPSGFVSISQVESSIIVEMRYYSFHNFIGSPIMGYDAPKCILTTEAATSLKKVQQELQQMNPPYSLKVYDCYRPQMSVDQFVLWSDNPNVLMKKEFYPELNKSSLFPQGYIARQSGHSRGSTIDLTIVPYPPPKGEDYHRGMPLASCFAPLGIRFGDNSIDMGTGFDCFSHLAHTDNPIVGKPQLANRHFLRKVMESNGFKNYEKEWWHYTLRDEPYPNTYFNFPIE